MDLGKLALLLAPGHVEGTGDPPDAKPTTVRTEVYGPDLWRITWATGDVLAHTRVVFAAPGSTFDGTESLAGDVNPGINSLDSPVDASPPVGGPIQEANDRRFFVFHKRNGVDSAESHRDTMSIQL